MKFLVTWVVVTWFAVACPGSGPSYDEFGREIDQSSVHLIACWDSYNTHHERYFNTKTEAEAFVKRAKDSCEHRVFGLMEECDLQDFKISEVQDMSQ